MHYKISFGKALEFFHCAYIRDTKTVVNVIHANRSDTILQFMENTIGVNVNFFFVDH